MIQQRRRSFTPVTLGLVVVAAALVAAMAWYLVSPLFIDRRVNESFPTSATPARGADAVPTAPPRDVVPSEAATAGASTVGQVSTGAPVVAAQPTSGASAAVPTSVTRTTPTRQDTPPGQQATGQAGNGPAVGGAASPGSVQPEGAAQTTVPTAAQPTGAPAPSADGPVATRRGEFGVVDAIHKGAGSATFYRLPDGRTVLRLEEFQVTNGPDLYVYLSGHPAPRSSGELHQDPDYEVAVLKGNVGDQNYELPADLDLDGVKSVVIYCKRFTTVFSTAELRPA